jgi:hypothetical protein
MESQGTVLVDSAEAIDAFARYRKAADGIFTPLQQQTQQLASNVLFLDESQAPWDGRVD